LLFASIAQSRRGARGGDRGQRIDPGSQATKAAFAAELEAWRRGGRVRRLWAGDPSLWTSTDEDKWLGWLTIVDNELDDVQALQAYADEVKRDGFTDIVLMGMGGSSLGPEVLSQTFGQLSGWPRFHMLDSTDPAQVKAIEDAVTLETTLFIVQSKSGSTLEPNIFTDYFFDRVASAQGKDKAGRQFVAVTDPGSSMETRAKDSGFAHVFYGVPSIGGRYSVLSRFGSGGGHGRRCASVPRGHSANGARLRSRRSAEREPRRRARRRLGRRRLETGPRQGHHHRLARHRRRGRLAGATPGREHGQAGQRPDPPRR
jgi:transaldolase/glucose-6-phosphate isomerase